MTSKAQLRQKKKKKENVLNIIIVTRSAKSFVARYCPEHNAEKK